MRKLLLIRHSQSAVTPGLAPARWPLTEEGRLRCAPFAQRVGAWQPTVIITSIEWKAHETGILIGEALEIGVKTHSGLHEHTRPAFREPDTPEAFRAKVAQLFERPDELVFGEETASQALTRFESAVKDLLAAHPGNAAVVTHGTVMALLVAKYNPVDVIEFWQNLAMPDLVVLEIEPLFQLCDEALRP